MKAIFRVDASVAIGSGHLVRCLNLARALLEHGVDSHFVTKSHVGNLVALVRDSGFSVSELALEEPEIDHESAYAAWVGGSWAADARETKRMIGADLVDWIIVDHYGLDWRWEKELRGSCKRLLVIDDLANRIHDCDLLLDQNLIAGMDSRYNELIPHQCSTMLGPSYALLQPDYAALRKRTPPREGRIQRILVYFGGADQKNLTGTIINILVSLNRDDIIVDVVINTDSPFAAEIHASTESKPNFVIHERKKSLAGLMVEADLAIGAGGVTSWERCCLGLPTLLITLAENQRPIATELDRLKLAIYAGDAEFYSAESLRCHIVSLLDQPLPSDWSERCSAVVDGSGAERVASILAIGVETVLTPRFATIADESLVLDWANDPEARRNAFSTDKISPETHHQWYRAKLRDVENCVLLIVEADKFLPVGQIRFDRRQNGWEISYMLDPCVRGRGIGTPLLFAAVQCFHRIHPDAAIFGRVKRGNLASCRVFERLGFSCEERPEMLTYSLETKGTIQ